MTEPVIIIHGGTGAKNPEMLSKIRGALAPILDQAHRKLLESDAVSAVAEAVRLMEDNVIFNAGIGSTLQNDGTARLSAAIMDGARQNLRASSTSRKLKTPFWWRDFYSMKKTVSSQAPALWNLRLKMDFAKNR